MGNVVALKLRTKKRKIRAPLNGEVDNKSNETNQ